MPINVIGQLEAISSYRHLFKAGTSRDAENPVAFAHQRMNLGGRVVSVLSRVSAYGLDYSGRSNKIAHHVTLEQAEMPAAGPAWLMSQRGVMRGEWLGQCETPATGPVLPRGDQTPRICSSWKNIAGDAGWGGVVAEAIASGSAEPLWVIYPLQHQQRLLELMDEAISLLPVSQRWRATFNTYAANIPPGVECKIRFVPDIAEEARFAKSSGKAIDLTKHQSITTASQWVEKARGSARREVGGAISSGGSFNAVQAQTEEQPVVSSWSSEDEVATGPPPTPEPPELPPELTRGKQTRKKILIAVAVLAVIVGLGSTWAVARLMAGLPILPGTASAKAPEIPAYIPDEDPEPVAEPVNTPRRVATETLQLVLHYDKKQILQWAAQNPAGDAAFPSPVSLRGFTRIKPIQYESDSEVAPPQQQTHGVQSAKLISWGGDLSSLPAEQNLTVMTTRLSEGTQTLPVQLLPGTPDTLGPTQIYCRRDTGDLIAIVDLDWNDTPSFLADQAASYRTYAMMVSAISKRLDSIEADSALLPELLQDAVDAFIRNSFPGRGESRMATLIRKGGGLDLAGEATKLSETLQSRMENTTRRLDKEQQAAVVRVVSDCERISQSAGELGRAFAVLEKGQIVEVPELRFHESAKVTLRRIPLRFHFSW